MNHHIDNKRHKKTLKKNSCEKKTVILKVNFRENKVKTKIMFGVHTTETISPNKVFHFVS